MTSRRAAPLVAVGYAIAALAAAAPMFPAWSTSIPSWRGGFDAPAQSYLLGWGWHALRTDPRAWIQVPIFHPEPRTLTYMDALVGETVLASPVLAATGSVAAGYNTLFLLSTFLTAWFTYRFARTVGAGRRGAFLAGLLVALGTYRLTNADFLNQTQTQLVPLGLDFAYRFVKSGKARHALGAFGAVGLQAYFGWYYTLILLVGIGLLLVHAALRGALRLTKGTGMRAASAALAGLAVAAPIAALYGAQRAAMPEFRRTLGQTALYSADLLDYARASDLAAGWSRLTGLTGVNALFPGWIAIVLAVFGVAEIRRRNRLTAGDPRPPGRLGYVRGLARVVSAGRERGSIVFLAATSFVLSLGPILHVAGRRLPVLLPYIGAYFLVPGLAGLRAPFRFAILVSIAIALLAALGYDRVARGLDRRSRVASGLVFAATLVVAVAPGWPPPPPLVRLPTRETAEPVYRWLAEREPKEPLLEFPTPARDQDETLGQALRQYAELIHGSPRLDGCSGFVSARYRAFRKDIQAFPDSAAIDLAARFGARWIVVHYADYPPDAAAALRSRVEASPALIRAAGFGADAVYRLAAADRAPRGLRASP